jgi:hypothetical protein
MRSVRFFWPLRNSLGFSAALLIHTRGTAIFINAFGGPGPVGFAAFLKLPAATSPTSNTGNLYQLV